MIVSEGFTDMVRGTSEPLSLDGYAAIAAYSSVSVSRPLPAAYA